MPVGHTRQSGLGGRLAAHSKLLSKNSKPSAIPKVQASREDRLMRRPILNYWLYSSSMRTGDFRIWKMSASGGEEG